ncbi:hypothetical protein T492DRAFT_891981 [Pavlovales sp. CCMP2436]|nr:hypothetical protein T492DRAFT_891981 [Pavlovales sp. CCMP2436]
MASRRGVTAFGRTNWTSIVFVRDPWMRAISSYRDQINRKIVKLRGNSRDDFFAFTRRRQGDGHHKACAVDFCGLRQPGVKYTALIDADGGWDRDWGELLRICPDLAPKLTTGW